MNQSTVKKNILHEYLWKYPERGREEREREQTVVSNENIQKKLLKSNWMTQLYVPYKGPKYTTVMTVNGLTLTTKSY